jgi:phage terminase small subunit
MTQQKKTDTFEVGELEDLTPKQLGFVSGILAGKTASDAYRSAYDCSNMLQETIWAEASRLRHDPKVAAWLTAARTANLGSVTVTLGGHLQELERLKEIAIQTGNVGAAVNAEVSRGKAAGHYVEKIANVTAENDVAETLRQIASIDPDLGNAVAAKYGLTIDKEATKH